MINDDGTITPPNNIICGPCCDDNCHWLGCSMPDVCCCTNCTEGDDDDDH